jgi:hypothetical protein
MLAFLVTLAVATSLAFGAPRLHPTHVHVSPACSPNQDPQGGCAA